MIKELIQQAKADKKDAIRCSLFAIFILIPLFAALLIIG